MGHVNKPLPPSDVILAELACSLSDVIFCLYSRITYLSTNIVVTSLKSYFIMQFKCSKLSLKVTLSWSQLEYYPFGQIEVGHTML